MKNGMLAPACKCVFIQTHARTHTNIYKMYATKVLLASITVKGFIKIDSVKKYIRCINKNTSGGREILKKKKITCGIRTTSLSAYCAYSCPTAGCSGLMVVDNSCTPEI